MENYKFIEKIGRGSHGTAYLLKSQDDNKFVVCKSFAEKHIRHGHKEVDILKSLSHRRIVKMIDNFSLDSSMFIILEYANYGTLESMIRYFQQAKLRTHSNLLWSLLAQISDALYFLHSKKVIHRDVKPSNILVNKFYVKGNEYLEFKLCDFSLSTRLEKYGEYIEDGATVGTPFYMAPELVSKGKYGFTVDVWALGVCMYEASNLTKPFTGNNRDELYTSIVNREIDPKELMRESQLSDIICKCLEKKERMTSKAIAKTDRTRLCLTMLELKYRESRIEILEKQIKDFENARVKLKN